MKKYIVIFVFFFLCYNVNAQNKKIDSAFVVIKSFFLNKDNYKENYEEVDITGKPDWKKDFYFYPGKDVNLTSASEGKTKRVKIPKIPADRASILSYVDSLKNIINPETDSVLFKTAKLDTLHADLMKIFPKPVINEQIPVPDTDNNDKKDDDTTHSINTALIFQIISAVLLVLLLIVLYMYFRAKRTASQVNNSEQQIKKLRKDIENLEAEIQTNQRNYNNMESEKDDIILKLEKEKSDLATQITKSKQPAKTIPAPPAPTPNKEPFPIKYYAQSTGGGSFFNDSRIKNKYIPGSTPYVLCVNETETEGEFYLYEDERNYEDAVRRHDAVLIMACEIPPNGIDKRKYSKAKTPKNGRGKIIRKDNKWQIVKKAEIELF